MIEALKEVIRRIIFFFSISGEFTATTGTLKHKFLDWLYGNGEPEFDVIWPDED